MSAFRKAANLNNQGVHALAEDNAPMAIECLSAALKLMKNELSMSKKRRTRSKTDSSSSSSSSSDDTMSDVSTMELPFLQREHDPCHIFNQGLIIPESLSSTEQRLKLSRSDVHVYTAVSIFNLSLAHHQNGKNNKRSKSLKKADQLYGVVLDFLSEEESQILNTSWISVVIQLASINNMAQLRFYGNDCDDTSTSSSATSSSSYDYPFLAQEELQFVRKTFESCSDIFMFQEPAIQSLLLHILTMDTHTRNAPAA